MVLIWVYFSPTACLQKGSKRDIRNCKLQRGKRGRNICLSILKASDKKIITLLHSSPQISVSFLPSLIRRHSLPSPAGRSGRVRVLTVIHGHSEQRRCPRELYAKAVGRATVAWARVQPEISSIYGRCVGARCEDTLFSKFSLEMQILFLPIYFSVEMEKNEPKQF